MHPLLGRQQLFLKKCCGGHPKTTPLKPIHMGGRGVQRLTGWAVIINTTPLPPGKGVPAGLEIFLFDDYSIHIRGRRD